MPARKEIIFIFPQEDGNFIYHLGAHYIISFLKTKGICAGQFVNNLPFSLNEIVEAILREKPRGVGFTVYDANYFLVRELAQRIKKKAPGIFILAGGPSATFSFRKILKDCPQIDICVRHEGEITTCQMIESLPQKKHLANIQGIAFRSGQGITVTPPRPLIKDKDASLDILSSPYLSGVLDVEDLIRTNNQRIPILTSRGCIYKCTYCNFSAMSRHTVRFHSPGRVIAELRMLDEFRKRGFDFEVAVCDDTFTLNRERVEAICRNIIEQKIRLNITGVEMRVDTVDRKLLELLFKAGISQINFGLESANPDVLDKVRKVRLDSSFSSGQGLEPERAFIRKISQGTREARNIGFKTSVSVIFGLPGDSRRRALKTLNFVKNLKVDAYAHNILTIHAGTALSRDYKRYGIKRIKRSAYILPDPILSPLSFPYDVQKLSRLQNEQDINVQYRYALSLLTSSLSGMYKRFKAHFYPEVVFVSGLRFPQQWLRECCCLQTGFIYPDRISNSMQEITLAVGIEVSCLHPKYSILKPEQLIKVVPEKLKFRFALEPFKKFSMDSSRGRIIYFLNDASDVEKLIEVSCTKESYDIGFSSRQRKDYLLLDGCRWSFNCSALSLFRLIVDEEDNLKVCFDSCDLGRVGEDLEDIRARLDKIYRDKAKERNCDKCSVRYTCSKCPFVNPQIEELYCRIKKDNPGIPHFLNSFQFSRKIDYLCIKDK